MPDTTSSAFDGEQMPSITRVVIENYKSIAHCDVRLGPLIFLVGRNGSGKSNFLDALRFVADALRTGLDAAVRSRGSIEDLRCRNAVPDASMGFNIEMTLPGGSIGHYILHLTQPPHGGYAIAEEQCTVEHPISGHPNTGFHVRDGYLLRSINSVEVPTDRLYLASSPLHYDRPVYELLANMAFYQLIPASMRTPQPHETGDVLRQDGSNVASVLLRLARQQPEALVRINEYLHAVLPTLQEVRAVAVGGYDALEFYQQHGTYDPAQFYRASETAARVRPFNASAMSDGTIHALGVLVALFQGGFGRPRYPTVVGIEEPETALHPAATGVLRDAFADTAELSQVLVTTQSADLLDDKDLPPECILAVDNEGGATRIGPLGTGQQSIMREHLATAGELLRTSTFQPELPLWRGHES
jgi:predicted ATPase